MYRLRFQHEESSLDLTQATRLHLRNYPNTHGDVSDLVRIINYSEAPHLRPQEVLTSNGGRVDPNFRRRPRCLRSRHGELVRFSYACIQV
jgi:hypothetical protein